MIRIITPEEKAKEERLQPMLMWPGVGQDIKTFPTVGVLYGRKMEKDRKQLSRLMAFVNAISCATERIWIMDRYFGKNVNQGASIIEYIEKVETREVRVISECFGDEIVKRIRQFRKKSFGKMYSPPDFGVQWLKCSSFPFLHDRFAIVDNELWHFGGSVGCDQEILTAASRGWSASNIGAIDQYMEIWVRLGGSRG